MALSNDGTRSDRAYTAHGMRPSELDTLCATIRQHKCRQILEIGMANASSTLRLLEVANELSGSVTSIDPFQFDDTQNEADSYNVAGGGVERVKQSGMAHLHSLMADFDYIALPELVRQSRKFDAIFIDGYHSFDYAFLDLFYADLLLTDGGLFFFHDTGMPSVHKAVQFMLRNKPYRSVGPRPVIYTPELSRRLVRKIVHIATGRMGEIRERQRFWGSLAALQKQQSRICPQGFIAQF